KFDEEGIKEVQSKFFNTLKNTYTFFQMYANTDKVDPRKFKVEYKDLEDIDKWLLSKYNKVVRDVTESLDMYDPNKAVKIVNNFVNEDLSNWYIRRNRRRFWGSELDNSKKAVYQTTYEVLCGICKLIAPMVPFTSEEIYTNLTGEKSVHLADYPTFDKDMVDEKIETKMDLVRDLISLGRNAREEAKIKVRQPISEVVLDNKVQKTIKELEPLIYEELNVKKIVYAKDLSDYMTFIVKPNFKVCGPVFGKNIKALSDKLNELDQKDIVKLSNNEEIKVVIDQEYTLTPEMVDIRINSREGFNAANSGNNFIILDTTLTKDLINEGIARELISKVQQMRKNKDFDIVDRIKFYYEKNDEFTKSIENYIDMIKNETLSTEIVEKNNNGEELDLNGLVVKVDVEKIKK
ncbi:MAG: class I tRNA ligase family protein, partial [Clostridia bacterium]|nr:class I tRNA ligase family protein [Clostridia bacterium]